VIGLLLGALLGAGLLLAIAGWRGSAPDPPLVAALQRVPWLVDPTESPAESWLAPLRPGADALARILGGRRALERRLRLAGGSIDVGTHLVKQVMLAGTALALALLLAVMSGAAQRPAALALLMVVALVSGLALGDYLLTRRIVSRRERIAEQFPVAAQLLALLVTAGTPPVTAVGRVGSAIGGPLGDELSEAARRSEAGEGFAASMRAFAAGTELPIVERFVIGLLSAIDRGSPLSDILRAQALEAASESQRALMVSAGRRDIAMLVPVVFVILPLVVVVAVLPGAVQLGVVGG